MRRQVPRGSHRAAYLPPVEFNPQQVAHPRRVDLVGVPSTPGVSRRRRQARLGEPHASPCSRIKAREPDDGGEGGADGFRGRVMRCHDHGSVAGIIAAVRDGGGMARLEEREDLALEQERGRVGHVDVQDAARAANLAEEVVGAGDAAAGRRAVQRPAELIGRGGDGERLPCPRRAVEEDKDGSGARGLA